MIFIFRENAANQIFRGEDLSLPAGPDAFPVHLPVQIIRIPDERNGIKTGEQSRHGPGMPVCHDRNSVQYFYRDRGKVRKTGRTEPSPDIVQFLFGNPELRRLELLQSEFNAFMPDGQRRTQGGKDPPRRPENESIRLLRRHVRVFPVKIPMLPAVKTADVSAPAAESVFAENIHQVIAESGGLFTDAESPEIRVLFQKSEIQVVPVPLQLPDKGFRVFSGLFGMRRKGRPQDFPDPFRVREQVSIISQKKGKLPERTGTDQLR